MHQHKEMIKDAEILYKRNNTDNEGRVLIQ